MLGVDTLDAKLIGIEDDDSLIECAVATGRVLLTKDQALYRRALKRGARAVLLPSSSELQESLEILHRDLGVPLEIDLSRTRCPLCNSPLSRVESDRVSEVPEPVRERHRLVYLCPNCGKVYWPGRHLKSMETVLLTLKEKVEKDLGSLRSADDDR